MSDRSVCKLYVREARLRVIREKDRVEQKKRAEVPVRRLASFERFILETENLSHYSLIYLEPVEIF